MKLMQRDICAAQERLAAHTPFLSLGIVFERNDAELLSSLCVEAPEEYNNFGALGRLESDLLVFLHEIGNETDHARVAAKLIAELVQVCLIGVRMETAWLTLRASKSTTRFDHPRWHEDGFYYEPYSGEPKKFVIALKGPGTRFAQLPEKKRKIRSKLFAEGLPARYCSQAATQELFIYIVGCEDAAAIHSEPPIHEGRIFMSIVPGSAAQIDELRCRWNAKATTYSPIAQYP